MFPKPLYSLAAALLAAPLVNGHYIFSQLVVNDQLVGGDYEYIRKNSNDYQPSITADVIGSKDLICNKGALEMGGSTGTYEVKAGDSIGAKLWYNELIEHPGPGTVYMSKAPGAVSEYMGDGDWFKVWESGPDNGPANVDESWGTWQQDRMTFTIPTEIEDGEYLVRFEHVGIHENHVGKAQFYMECAQLSISGGSGGTPSPMVKFPDVYSAEDPAFTYSIWGGSDPGYTMPGGAVATFGAGSGSSSSSSSSSDNTTETETETPAASGSSSTGAEAPASSSSASTGSQAPATGSAPAQGSQTGGEMTASVPTTQNNQGQAQGGWGGASAGSWGTASTEEKTDCEVQYIGGSAARARRAVRA